MAKVYNKCHLCKGVGTYGTSDVNNDPITCLHCGGAGRLEIGEADTTDIEEKLDALDTKMDTLETHLDTIESKIDAL